MVPALHLPPLGLLQRAALEEPAQHPAANLRMHRSHWAPWWSPYGSFVNAARAPVPRPSPGRPQASLAVASGLPQQSQPTPVAVFRFKNIAFRTS